MRAFPVVSLLLVSLAAGALATPAASIDSKSSSRNPAVESKSSENSREGHSLQLPSSYSSVPAGASSSYHSLIPQQSYHVQQTGYQAPRLPVPATYSSPHDTSIGYVYYYLPQKVQKYYPKFKDILPYIRNYAPLLDSALPKLRYAAERTFDVGSAIGVAVLAPIITIGITVFISFMAISLIVPVFSFGRKRSFGRSFSSNGIFDGLFNSENKSRALDFLSARVDSMLNVYQRALQDDRCLEKFSCEAGELSSRFGSFVSSPLISLIEPYIPDYMSNKLTAFKKGARSSSGCSEYKCKAFFGSN